MNDPLNPSHPPLLPAAAVEQPRMHFLSSKKLEAELAAGQLSDWGKTRYLVLQSIVTWALATPIWVVSPHSGHAATGEETLFGLATAIIAILIVIQGVKKCFATNQQIDRDHFIERVVVLMWPIMIRLMIVMLPLTLAAAWTTMALLKKKSSHAMFYANAVFDAIALATTWLFFILLNRSLARFGRLFHAKQVDADAAAPHTFNSAS